MDYLSGRQNNIMAKIKDDRTPKISKNESVFTRFCDNVLECLNPDERASISDKFLNPEIISVMKDVELVECINAFFKNNLNISETSRNAFLHRNTLLYRIEKIYKNTGLNIRNFEDAMSFKLLTIVYNNMKDRTGRK